MDTALLTESRDQSSELQEEMRSDMELLTERLQEANEQVDESKARLIGVKEVAIASKARSDRQVAQLGIEREAIVVAMRELRIRVELEDAIHQRPETPAQDNPVECKCSHHKGTRQWQDSSYSTPDGRTEQ